MLLRRATSWMALLATVPLLASPLPCCALAALTPVELADCCQTQAGPTTAPLPSAPLTSGPACPHCESLESTPAESGSPASSGAPKCCCDTAPEPAALLSPLVAAQLSLDSLLPTAWVAPSDTRRFPEPQGEAAVPFAQHPPLRVLLCTWLI